MSMRELELTVTDLTAPGRALQAPALTAWRGDAKNHGLAQQAQHKRARQNSAARQGRYTTAMKQEPADE